MLKNNFLFLMLITFFATHANTVINPTDNFLGGIDILPFLEKNSNESLLTNTITQMLPEEIKALQTQVISQLKSFQLQLSQLGFKLNKVQFKTKESKEKAACYVRDIKDILDRYIKKYSLAATQAELSSLVIITKILIDNFEDTLNVELKTIPEMDTVTLARYFTQDFSLEELAKTLQSNEKKIATFNERIATLNLNLFQKAYIKCAYKWNAPILSIPALEKDIYVSTILKKICVYGGITALAIHNLPDEQLEHITPTWLKNILSTIKNHRFGVGSAAYAVKKSSETTYLAAISTDGYATKDGKEQYVKNQKNEWVKYGVEKSEESKETKRSLLNFGGLLNFGEKKSSQLIEVVMPATFDPAADPNLVPCTFAQFIEQGYDITTGQPIKPGAFYSNSPTTLTPKVTIASSHDGSALAKGILGKLTESIGWIVDPGIGGSLGFNLGLGALLAKYIYEDIATLKKDIPLLASYTHALLTGNKDALKGAVEIPEETFDDVVGREGIKSQLQLFIDFIVNPKQMTDAGIKLPRGILLAGEPQTGKTFMVKAMAGELTKALKATGKTETVKLFTVSLDFLLKEGFSKLMWVAEHMAPCIIFCDEFDMMQLQRTGDTKNLAEALTVLGGASATADLDKFVLFMAATNKPENIDYALRADGRLSVKLYFENPNFADRKEYLTRFFTKKLINYSSFDLNGLVQETENCSYGTIDTLAQSIIALASQDNENVSQKHIDKALNTCVKNIIYDGYDVPEDKRHAIAVRFATKTLTALLLHPEKEFVLSTILKKNNPVKEQLSINNFNDTQETNKGVSIGGIFCYNTTDTAGIVSNNELLKECLIHLAGTIGQQVVNLDYVNYADDEKLAYNLVLKMMQLDHLLQKTSAITGTAQETLPEAVKEQKLQQAYTIIAECKKMLRTLLASYKDEIESIALMLEKKQIIRKNDILPLLHVTPATYAQQTCALDLQTFITQHVI